MAGPMRLHVSSLTAHATALAANSVTTAVADRTAAVLQLRLAARRLRQLGAAEAAEAHAPLALAAAEWAAAAAVAATTLEAHLPAVESEEGRQEVGCAFGIMHLTARVGGGCGHPTHPAGCSTACVLLRKPRGKDCIG